MPNEITNEDVTKAIGSANGEVKISNKIFSNYTKLGIMANEYIDAATVVDGLVKGLLEHESDRLELTLEKTELANVLVQDVPQGMKLLCAFFNAPEPKPRLEKLSLPYNNIDSESATILSLALRDNATLKHLDISCNVIGSRGLGEFIGALASIKTLESLCIGDSEDKITNNLAESLIEILHSNMNLVNIDIKEWRHSMSDNKMQEIKALSLINKSQPSQHLDLKGLNVTPISIKRIFRDDDVESLKSFKSLRLDNSGVNDDIMFSLCENLQNPHCTLQDISLKNNKDISTRGIIALANVIKGGAGEGQKSSLEKVDLRGLTITEEAAQALLEALKLNPNIIKYQFDGHANEKPITRRTSVDTRELMSSDVQERNERSAQEMAESSFHDDISSLSRKRRAEEVALLRKGREGFENLDRYFSQFSRSLMAEISPHIDNYTKINEGKPLEKKGVDLALDGLEAVARLVDGIEFSPLTGTMKIEGLSHSMQSAIEAARGFRQEKRAGESENTHDNLISKSQLNPQIEDAINLIARGLLISYRFQLEKLDPRKTKGVFDEMAKAIVGEMARDKDYANISSVLDRSMTALFNGIASNEKLPYGSKYSVKTKDPEKDKNWNLYSMIRRCGVTSFTYTGNEIEPVEQVNMVRNEGGKGFRPGFGMGDNNFGNSQAQRRRVSREKYGYRLGSSHHVVTTDFYEPCDMTRPLQENGHLLPDQVEALKNGMLQNGEINKMTASSIHIVDYKEADVSVDNLPKNKTQKIFDAFRKSSHEKMSFLLHKQDGEEHRYTLLHLEKEGNDVISSHYLGKGTLSDSSFITDVTKNDKGSVIRSNQSDVDSGYSAILGAVAMNKEYPGNIEDFITENIQEKKNEAQREFCHIKEDGSLEFKKDKSECLSKLSTMCQPKSGNRAFGIANEVQK